MLNFYAKNLRKAVFAIPFDRWRLQDSGIQS